MAPVNNEIYARHTYERLDGSLSICYNVKLID